MEQSSLALEGSNQRGS